MCKSKNIGNFCKVLHYVSALHCLKDCLKCWNVQQTSDSCSWGMPDLYCTLRLITCTGQVGLEGPFHQQMPNLLAEGGSFTQIQISA